MEDNWISTKEKLPETRQYVLFFRSKHYAEARVEAGIFVLNYENEHGKYGAVFIGANKTFNKLETVTHWQPLPAPPQTVKQQ